MAKRLTDISIRNLKPGPIRREISDHANGLFLLVQPSGVKSFAVRYRFAGRSVKLTVGGKFPTTTLADARKLAADAQLALEQGNNPAKAKVDAKIAADAAKDDTVTAICEKYLAIEGKKLRTVDQRVSALRRLIYPALGERPIGEIKRSEIVTVLDKIENRNGPRAAHAALSLLRRIFHWYELRSDEFRSPIIRGMARVSEKERARSRVLTDDEIRAIWKATADPLDPFAALVRFLLLTSARRNEAAGMRPGSEIDADGVWTLPRSRSKTKAEVVRPLSKAALAILDGLPRIDGCAYAFSANGLTAFSNFSRPKADLDAASGVSGWRLHDLRRTVRSLLSRCKGVTVDHAERVLGHALPGIRATYDKHDYAEEIRFAVEALAAQIETITNPPAGGIADMAAERARRQPRRARS